MKKVHRGNKFNQKAWLETYMIIELRQKAATNFEKGLLKLMNNAVFKKNHVKCKRTQRHYTCHNKKKKELFSARTKLQTISQFFSENLLAIELKKKTQVLMNNPVYLGLSVLELGKIVMYEFWYDCLKPKDKIVLHGYRHT